ncbi:MAG TPA: L-threonylcarbamoyladenylate synthase [Thermoanaerobaculaceae bacterium]|nr:L-threonylcarbamoyladenylate synthase [Thermoanaerobaculaceae bacterium]HRS15813.1 L-threonylcarbamoyladenylate synthase [Thermoanaerobaculaceae bacterium]
MRVQPFHADSDLPAAAAACRAALDGHGVVAVPTETFYGLAVDPRDAAAVEAVLELKGRPADKALPLVAADLDQVAELVVLAPVWVARLAAVWPAPLTVVAPVRQPLPACGRTAAVRVPGHGLLRALLRMTGPLTATSANPSGLPALISPAAVAKAFGRGLALLLDGGDAPGGSPSTLVDICSEVPKLLRPGAFRPPREWLVNGA